MATAIISAALSVVHTALSPLTDSLLEKWAASKKLGSNVKELELELLAVQALLEHTVGKEIVDNSALKKLMVMLQDLGYDAEDVLDELEYFRIQDELDGTFDAADKHAKGVIHNLALNAKAVGKRICLPACLSAATCRACCSTIHTAGKCFPCSSMPSARAEDDSNDVDSMNNSPQRNDTNDETPKLRFNRVYASARMHDIAEQLRLMRGIVSSTITILGSNWSTVRNIAESRPITISESIEPKLYGRNLIMGRIIHDIIEGKHSSEHITIIPIVGLGGIGKTTLAQNIYHSKNVQEHFQVMVWTCVSLNFNVIRLIQEIEKGIPKVDGESGTPGELIGKRLKNKRFLLVLDDIWDCSNEDEWERLLVPFKKSQVMGNVIIVTTRFPAQAKMVKTIDHPIHLQGLDHEELKGLFLDFVFGADQSRKGHMLLLETGDKIVHKLKGSPLAAKTVGRLLKTKLDPVYWTRVLESNGWEQSDGDNDIMPALKLSYDHLPPHLQRCFSYCALFPQDYKFKEEELINFWIGLDVLHSSHGKNERIEDIGQSHLTQLVNHGFFEKEGKEDGSACYIIHDLLHELARKVSSHECLCIKSSQVRSLQIPPSIRHLSISIDDTSVQDRLTLKNCVEDFRTLDKRLKVEKLRSLMLFGKHHDYFLDTFGDLFRQARALRVILLHDTYFGVEDLLHNFYNLLHLRYLRIQSSDLPHTRFSRFYHLMVLDAKHCKINNNLQRNMSNLVKLRHFLVEDDATHSSILEVGKLKSLQELRQFVVKKDNQGFELKQIGNLVQLRGSLCIGNLENVRVKEEADEAKLLQKIYLCELILHWNLVQSTDDSTLEEYVLERLKPSSNLLRLSIIGHRGEACPPWLGKKLSVQSLESLCLDGVAWKTFPPIGELWLVNVPHEDIVVSIPDIRFANLKRLKLVNLPMLKTWALHAPCQLFPGLEVLIIKGCRQLEDLSFSHSGCCQQEKHADVNFFPRLSKLKIENCEQLLSFPPVPWTNASCSTRIAETGSSCLHALVCGKNYKSEYSLKIVGKDTTDRMFWNVLAFHNLTKLKEIEMQGCHPMPLHCLQMLSSLRILTVDCVGNDFPFEEGDSHEKYQLPVESMLIRRLSSSGKELTQLLAYFPKLLELKLVYSEKITGLFLLPPQIQELHIYNSPELTVHLNPLDNNKGEWFQSPSSLRRLNIWDCPKLLTSYLYPSFSSYFPFPNSLEYLELRGKVDMEVPVPLSNLNSLTSIFIDRCGDLRGKGLLSLLAQGHLTELTVLNTLNFFVDHEQELPPRSSRLQKLWIGDVAGFTALPSLHYSSLTILMLEDEEVECFTEEQEALLFVNSLEEIRFMSCKSLRYLPARLSTLPHLKKLYILECIAIKMLPEDGLPSSLQELHISNLEIRSLPDGLPTSLRELSICNCPEIRSLPDGLPCSLQELVIQDCAGIQSLPKFGLPNSLQRLCIVRCPAISSLPKVDDLPSSLQELIFEQGREELRRQCLKLKQIIPIVQARDMRR